MSVDNNQNECGIWEREGGCLVPLVLLEALPVYYRETIPEEYLDLMGHMNIRWYFEMFGQAGHKFFASHGLEPAYFQEQQAGLFALKHFIQYFAEVRAGQTVAVHTRLVGRSDKRFQILHFMLNETTAQLASTFEALITHADLQTRRSAPMPACIAEELDATLAKDDRLDWQAPVCGVMRL